MVAWLPWCKRMLLYDVGEVRGYAMSELARDGLRMIKELKCAGDWVSTSCG